MIKLGLDLLTIKGFYDLSGKAALIPLNGNGLYLDFICSENRDYQKNQDFTVFQNGINYYFLNFSRSIFSSD